MKRSKRTPTENEFLKMKEELVSDARTVKRKSDSNSHRNKEILKWKINIIESLLLMWRSQRMNISSSIIQEKVDVLLSKVPTNVHTIKYRQKLFSML